MPGLLSQLIAPQQMGGILGGLAQPVADRTPYIPIIRDQQHLNRLIENADSDAKLRAIWNAGQRQGLYLDPSQFGITPQR